MDAPPIQYARTEDGVNLAYWTVGEGPPLVYAPAWPTHAQVIWEVAPAREMFTQLAKRYRVTYFDPRSFGLSDPAPEDVSLDAFAGDFAAVFEVVGLPEAAIFAEGFSVHPAIRFAAANPQLVTGLALYGSAISYPEWVEVSSLGRVVALLADARSDTQFDAARQAFLGVVDRLSPEDFVKLTSGLGTRGQTDRSFDNGMQWEASDDAASLSLPVLVMARQDDTFYPVESMRPLAAAIPNARFLVLPGKGAWAFDGNVDPMLNAVDDLLKPGTPDADRTPQGFRTLLFTDLESSTALTQSLGDAKAQEILRGHNEAVRAALEAHSGEEVKHTGDGIMAAFTSAVSAVEAALQIQRELAGAEVRVRVGLNAGEPIAEDDDYFGAAVQLAARVCDRAEPGQVLVPSVVRDLCRGKTFTFEDQGEATLKGFPEPVRLFVVGKGE